MKRLKRACVALVAGLVVSVSAAADDPIRLPDLGDAGGQTLSVAEERRIGEQLIRQVRMRVPMAEDPEVRDYVQQLGTRLLSHADVPDFEFEFFVVDSPAINAFAMPGGNIGINSGLMRRARSESELAGVMAHEIAHVSQRHIARRMDDTRGAGLRTLGILLAAVLMGTQDGDLGSAAALGGIAGSIQEQLNYSRAHEREADNIGIRILADAGLDPEGMVAFFERLDEASRHQQRPPEYLSTHPMTQSRIAESRSRARQYAPRDPDESPMFGLVRAKLLTERAGSPDDALRFFQGELDQADEGSAEAHAARFGRALTYMKQGRFQDAREALQALMTEDGEHAPYFIALARVDREEGDRAGALTWLEDGLAIYPGHYPLVIHKARALIADGRAEDARNLLRRHIQRRGGDPELFRLLAEAATESGREAEGLLAMAEHYDMRGNTQLALHQLERVMNDHDAGMHERSRAASRHSELRQRLEREQAR